jgi:hypothetical protein
MTHAKTYSPPTPTRQTFSPWVRDGLGNLSREIRAVEIVGVTPREEFVTLRLRLANSESTASLESVRAAAAALAERADEDLREDVLGLLDRCRAKLMRAQAP